MELFMASCRFGRALSDVGRRKWVEVQISFWPHFEHVAGRPANRNRLRGNEFQTGRPLWWPVLGSETEAVGRRVPATWLGEEQHGALELEVMMDFELADCDPGECFIFAE